MAPKPHSNPAHTHPPRGGHTGKPKKKDFQPPHLKRFRSRLETLRRWLVPFGLIVTLAISAFLWFSFADYSQGDGQLSFRQVIFLSQAQDVGGAIGGVAEVLIAILGLVITVVAIVVQLAAQRYTPKLVDLFIADKINIGYFVLMVVASMYSLLLIYSSKSTFLPFWGSLFLLVMTTLILGLLIPYFNHVFLFLTPGNILSIIHQNANRAMNKVMGRKSKPDEFQRYQNEVAMAMEQISDIALSAVSQMDRNVALLAIRALREVMVDHLLTKRRMPHGWMVPQKDHFAAASSEFLHEVYTNKTWVEIKGFMDMELIFKMAIQEMPDAVTAVANSAKVVGLYALRMNDLAVLQAVIEFFNTFLRLAVNNRNPRAIYNLFYQYRLLAEAVLEKDPKRVERIAFYFKYYGQIAQSYNVPMILITAAFDLAQMMRKAYSQKAPNMDELVNIFLTVDDNPNTQANEFDLRSVRKAQLNFAAFLMSQGDERMAARFFEDMKHEPKSRMEAIRKEMLAVTDRKFWEVTDRGVDFFFLDEDQKKHLNAFFTRFVEPYYQAHPELAAK